MDTALKRYAPDFPPEEWSARDRLLLQPFATGLDGHVHVLRNLPPEIVGALCSRASRAASSLLRVLLKEYFYPILEGENRALAAELDATAAFLRNRGFKEILNNDRAQAFYAKWLSQYGDDSIAQMTGTHALFWGISQVALKFLEDQRIGLEPIEKSTRYVNYGGKVGGRYLYYIPYPDLEARGILHEYRAAMDHLFDTYAALLPQLMEWLTAHYDDKPLVLEKKAFDTLRGLLPMATVSQVAFRGNAQAFEYLINRTARHPLGELRWIGAALKEELDHEIPSLLLRVADEKSVRYQEHLRDRKERIRAFAGEAGIAEPESASRPHVGLVEWDPETEVKIVAGLLFEGSHRSWGSLLSYARTLSEEKRKEIFTRVFRDRTARWYKVPRAFENAYARFEIVMNIGAYRDLHRHRMMTQERQSFSTFHGYDVPPEVKEAGLTSRFEEALEGADALFRKLHGADPELAQYTVPLAYRLRFFQWTNVRQIFWESELRTISQGHPDYRWIEQEKHRLFAEKFPLIASYVQVDHADYKIARRGTEEKIAAKEREIVEKLGRRSADT
ncbi:MAG: FAD-dependent thymidylate synthase [Candidatus Liptonbacteria bacterium]|nr:FAD-dependent thymidylate synthase [Candidatus Liptonbacteria bacterium]